VGDADATGARERKRRVAMRRAGVCVAVRERRRDQKVGGEEVRVEVAKASLGFGGLREDIFVLEM
jgi:hypothetical protein